MKESNFHHDKNVIFRETFNSEQDTIRNGGTSTDVTYSNGIGNFNGSSSYVQYNKNIKGIYSVRIRFKSYIVSGSSKMHIDFRNNDGSGVGYINEAPTTVLDVSSGTKYIDGSLSSLITNNIKEIIVTGITLNCNLFTVFSNYLMSGNLECECDLIEIYEGTLTANEVALLYENSLYKEPIFDNEVLSIDSRNGGIVDRWGNTLINTDVEIVRDGSIWTQEYNNSSSKLDAGSFGDLTGDLTILAWIKPFGWGEDGTGRILDNGKLKYGVIITNDRMFITSNSTLVYSANNSIDLNKWQFIAVTRTSAGIVNHYINGILSGTPNQNSDTPVAASTNLFIGNKEAVSATFNGNIPIVKIVSGILSTKQIENYYNATKRYFNK